MVAWFKRPLPLAKPGLGLLVLSAVAVAFISGCASTNDEGVACATPSSFQHALELRGSDCNTPFVNLLAELDDGTEATQLHLAEQLEAVDEYALAVYWYEQAHEQSASREAMRRLLALHSPQGRLADDAAYLRYEVLRAQQQQRFGEEVSWPRVNQAQPLYVQVGRSALLRQPDLDAEVVAGLDEDERVYLLNVVMFEQPATGRQGAEQPSHDYWVEAYYAPTLQLGWIPAEELSQQTGFVRQQLAQLDQYEGRHYAQQLLFAAVIGTMDLSRLTPLNERDYFDGASRQQSNTMALLQGLGAVADSCLAEIDALEAELEHYLMDEGPQPQWHSAAVTERVNQGLHALTNRSDEALRVQLVEDAYRYFRIRVRGQVEQRLCVSLPNAAGNADLSDPACEASRRVQQCINRANAIFDYLGRH